MSERRKDFIEKMKMGGKRQKEWIKCEEGRRE